MSANISMGRLDHMHLVVPDREEAARWYEETLGFTRVQAYQHWWDVPGGPLHISADGGDTGLALFQAGDGHEATDGIGMGVAFVVPGDEFIKFAKALATSLSLQAKDGTRLSQASIVDLDLCFSFGFMDPYGHELELSTYNYDEVKAYLADEGISAVRYW